MKYPQWGNGLVFVDRDVLSEEHLSHISHSSALHNESRAVTDTLRHSSAFTFKLWDCLQCILCIIPSKSNDSETQCYVDFLWVCKLCLTNLDRTSLLLFTWITWRSWAWRTPFCWRPTALHSPELPGWPGGHRQTAPFRWRPGLCLARRSAWVSPQTRPGRSPPAVSERSTD